MKNVLRELPEVNAIIFAEAFDGLSVNWEGAWAKAARVSRRRRADNGLLLNAIGLSLIINGHQLGAEIAPSVQDCKNCAYKKT